MSLTVQSTMTKEEADARIAAIRNAPPTSGQRVLSVFVRMRNLTKSVLLHVLRGFPQSDLETLTHRVAQCQACPFLTEDGHCGTAAQIVNALACGCNVAVKAEWADSVCPQGRWSK